MFQVFFSEASFTYGEGDVITSVCVDAVGRIDRDDVTATISSVATGTATGEMADRNVANCGPVSIVFCESACDNRIGLAQLHS